MQRESERGLDDDRRLFFVCGSFRFYACFDLCVMIRLMSSQHLLLRLRRWLRQRLHPPWKIFIFKFDSRLAALIERESERASALSSFCANWKKLESMKCRVRFAASPCPCLCLSAGWLIGCVCLFLLPLLLLLSLLFCAAVCCCCVCVSCSTGRRVQLESFSAHFKFDCICFAQWLATKNKNKKNNMPKMQCAFLVTTTTTTISDNNNNNTHFTAISCWVYARVCAEYNGLLRVAQQKKYMYIR